jgi:hypothetical protein
MTIEPQATSSPLAAGRGVVTKCIFFTNLAVTHSSTGCTARVELHIPSTWGKRSLLEWMEWFKRHERGD